MRISTNWNQQLGVNAILDQQAKVSETQMKLSTGKRILTPSEDPAASVRLLDLEQVTQQTRQYQDNIVMARQRLSLEEANVEDVFNVLNRIKQLTVQGLNDTYSQVDRAAIASELDELNGHLLGIANTKNANGEYIFAGYATATQPYQKGFAFSSALVVDSNPAVPTVSVDPIYSYPYFGDVSQREIQIAPTRVVTDGNYGVEIFGASQVSPSDLDLTNPANTDPLPVTKQPQNLFELVGKLSVLLRGNNPIVTTVGGVEISPLENGLKELDDAIDRVVSVQTTIGARQNALDRQESINEDYILDMQTATSTIGDLDFAEAISKFNIQNVALQAAQQAYTKVQNLSLFNFMR